MSKVRMGLVGGLTSLASGLVGVGAYFVFGEERDPITQVLSLEKKSRKGKCKVQVESSTSWSSEQPQYSEFYGKNGDAKGAIANACLQRLSKEDKDVLVKVTKNSDGTYTFQNAVTLES